MPHTQMYDSIVVGAGHAGSEAALAVARAGHQVLLLTMNRSAICQMSCNPAIGGLAKGHMVRELDALGGEMGLAIDQTAIQFRMLNRSKGPAVWAPRAQADKEAYRLYMTRTIEDERNIDLVEGQAVSLLVRNGKAVGVRTAAGNEYSGRTVVITTGTFMCGLIHVGEDHFEGGRRGEKPSVGLSDSLRQLGFEMARFKTGTPCRLRDTSIDYSACEEQKGDPDPEPFSFRTPKIKLDQMSCWLTHTNQGTHDLIRNNLHRSPLYAGRIKGIGPRYCPSIEDKVVKFSDKPKHQLYLEPEGRNTEEVYVNGLSTSLPKEIQAEFIRTIRGLERAEIIRFGYAIEYDCMPPTQMNHSLETKRIENLFFAGQVNCTSGYEEAAAQGLMAGLNVIRKLNGKPPFVLDRSEAYIGVLIDDLVTRGTSEPYRMFTSRAEFRLLLRQDNADKRLMKYGREFGLISENVYSKRLEHYQRADEAISKLKSTFYRNAPLEILFKRNNIDHNTLLYHQLKMDHLNDFIKRTIQWDIKYDGYIKRQLVDVEKFKKLEKRLIPLEIDYALVRGLSTESREKLTKVRPTSIGQASRIPGVNSCDISVLLVAIGRLCHVSRETTGTKTECS